MFVDQLVGADEVVPLKRAKSPPRERLFLGLAPEVTKVECDRRSVGNRQFEPPHVAAEREPVAYESDWQTHQLHHPNRLSV